MGAMLTQHPDLMKCVVSHVGIYDMLRVELSPNGAFNIPEFGTVKDAEQFQALYAYSPYHHVKDGREVSGRPVPDRGERPARRPDAVAEDDRPTSSSRLRCTLCTSANSGHGAGTPLNARIEECTDAYAFLFDQLGVKVKE